MHYPKLLSYCVDGVDVNHMLSLTQMQSPHQLLHYRHPRPHCVSAKLHRSSPANIRYFVPTDESS